MFRLTMMISLTLAGLSLAGLSLAGVALGGTAMAADRPQALPMRDVDIMYDVPTRAGMAPQRLRFSALRQTMRIDPPGGGLYVVIDQLRGRMFTVRDADRSVIDMAAPRSWMPGITGGSFLPRGQDHIIGHPCTNWQTTDSERRTIVMCVTEDGLMLRAATVDGKPLLAARSVHYASQDASVFHVPADYRRLSPPPLSNAR